MASHPLSRDFIQRTKDQQVPGLTCEGSPAYLVPHSALLEYWTIHKLRTLCNEAAITTPPAVIRDQYLRVFCILVVASHNAPRALEFFDNLVVHSRHDETLPWGAVPGVMQDDPRTSQTVLDAQWPFCPVLLLSKKPLSNNRLDRRCVFPFFDPKNLGTPRVNSEAKLSSVGISRRAYEPFDSTNRVPSRVVLKTYPQAFQASYDTERRAYGALSPRSPNILQCLGSFHWLSANNDCTNVLIFEYAEGGTLLNLFERGISPFELTDIFAMWKGLVDMVKGLEAVHEQDGLRGIHQDLKPSNILVFPQRNAKSPFSYTLKISDFGASHIPFGDDKFNGENAVNSRATRTYGAPELHLGEDIRYNVKSEVDMWSIGCILVEAAVWMSLGEAGRLDFTNRRVQETSSLPEHEDRGRHDCFHDGSEVLKTVKGVLGQILQQGRPCDRISAQVVELVLDELLIDKNGRLRASQFHARLARVVHTAQLGGNLQNERRDWDRSEEVPTSSPPSRPRALGSRTSEAHAGTLGAYTLSPTRTNGTWTATLPMQPSTTADPGQTPNLGSPYPPLLIDELSRWRYSKSGSVLPGWNQAKMQLKDRDFSGQFTRAWLTVIKIFVIDNSSSMQKHIDDVLLFVHCVGYLVKQLDRNGLQVIMTSNPRDPKTCKTSTEAKDFVKSRFRHGGHQCNMAYALEQALQDVYGSLAQLAPTSKRRSLLNRAIHGKAKPFSILVFTDGVWNDIEDGVSGADHPIEECIRMMKEHNVSKSNVAIQFLRFGDEQKGIKRLTFLDDELGQFAHNDRYDIVDHKSRNASIWDILAGSLWDDIDRIK